MVGWLAGWLCRQSHVIVHAAGAGTGYQVKINVHSGAGASSGDDVYLHGNCTDFPNDIDFAYDVAGTATQLSFFIEDATVDPIVVWVKVAEDLTSINRTIYIYYDKLGQSSLVDPTNTFIKYHGAAPTSFLDAPAGLGTQLRFKSRARVTSSLSSPCNILFGIADTSNFGTNSMFVRAYQGSHTYLCTTKATAANQKDHGSQLFVQNVYTNVEILYNTTIALFYVGSTLVDTSSVLDLPTLDMALAFLVATGTGDEKWSFVSKYVSPEPANSTWGAEEAAGTLSGVTRNSAGNPLGSCNVLVFRTSDNAIMASGVSDATTGAYTFHVATGVDFFVVAFKSGSPDVMGVTDNNIEAV